MKSSMRFMISGLVLVLSITSLAKANLIPYDPHVLLASGGDATPISSPLPITFSAAGGGIFVFENDTGADLAKFEADIAVPNSFATSGFTVNGTIFVPPGTGQQVSFSATFVPGSNCAGASDSEFCEKMTFALVPGPLIPAGGNFVLDFDEPPPGGYQPGTVDGLVATGQYSLENCIKFDLPCNGETDTSSGRTGAWPIDAQGVVTPFVATPEPRYYAGLLAGILAIGIYARRRRTAAVR